MLSFPPFLESWLCYVIYPLLLFLLLWFISSEEPLPPPLLNQLFKPIILNVPFVFGNRKNSEPIKKISLIFLAINPRAQPVSGEHRKVRRTERCNSYPHHGLWISIRGLQPSIGYPSSSSSSAPSIFSLNHQPSINYRTEKLGGGRKENVASEFPKSQ